MGIWKVIGGLASPGGEKGKLSILIFHSICETPDPLEQGNVTLDDFNRILHFIKRNYSVLPLSEAITRLRNNELPKRALSITFDDGYSDNYHVALPLLVKWRLPATFFIATSFLDGGIMWNDSVKEVIRVYSDNLLDLSSIDMGQYSLDTWSARRYAAKTIIDSIKYLDNSRRAEIIEKLICLTNVSVPKNLMLTTGQLRSMHQQGMEIGGHTVSHPILAKLSQAEAWHEISEGKKIIENKLDQEIKVFAYPNGKPGQDYNRIHATLVKKAGFIGAVSTSWGVNDNSSDLYQLARFTPWNTELTKFGVKMLLNHYTNTEIALD